VLSRAALLGSIQSPAILNMVVPEVRARLVAGWVGSWGGVRVKGEGEGEGEG